MRNGSKIFERCSNSGLISVAILCGVAVLFLVGCSSKPTLIDSSNKQILARLDQELQRSDHPLRLLIEKQWKESGKSDDSKIKRILTSLQSRDVYGNQITVQWDEYRYKSWGGWFFHAARQGIIETRHENDHWEIVTFFHDTPFDSDEQQSDDQSGVFVKRWNTQNNTFEEFNEHIAGRFDSQKPVVVLVHGMGESTQKSWLAIMAERLSKFDEQTSVLAIDWSKFSQPQSDSKFTRVALPVNTAQKIPYVAGKVNEYLFETVGLNLALEKTHLIGFSHGAHVVGLVGTQRSGKVKRITILDPSTSKVHWGSQNRFGEGWNSQSAQFLDMYRTSGWAGTGKARGYKVFYVLEKGHALHATWTTAEDHNYAPHWFASTIGKPYHDFGYSISTERTGDIDDIPSRWSGLIISTLPKSGDRNDIENAISSLVPFPGGEYDQSVWSKDKQMYNELCKVTDIILEEITVDPPAKKSHENEKLFTPGDTIQVRIRMSNGFNRNDYFDDGIWGFTKNRKFIGTVWLSDSLYCDATICETENVLPVSSVGVFGSTQVSFEIIEKRQTQAEAVATLRLPKRTLFDEKFKRSRGNFHLNVDLGGQFTETKTFYDLNDNDNYGSVKIYVD